MSRTTHRRRRRERGGIAALVVVLLALGVFTGVSALTLDVGSIWWERRQLQNSADSASLALASACARNAANCSPTNPAIATYRNLNVADGTTSNDGVCAKFGSSYTPAAVFTTCPSATDDAATEAAKMADLAQCPPLPAWLKTAVAANGPVNYVEVRAGTAGTGSTASPLGNIFGKMVRGQDNPHVSACARAAWGPAKSSSLIPLTFSECEFNAATTNASTFGVETALPLKYAKNTPNSCDSYKGRDYDGGFGWIKHPNGVCTATYVNGDWVEAETGVGAGNDCIPKVVPGSVLYLPIYDCINKTKTFCGNDAMNPTTYYHIAGLAAFEVTAIDITGQTVGTPGTDAKKECQKESLDNKCLYGKFLKALVATGTIDTSGTVTNYGLQVTLPAG